MSNKELIEIDVSLLLVRYGRDKVLRALASKIDCTVEDLLAKTQKACDQLPKAPHKPRAQAQFHIDEVISQYPEKGTALKMLFDRYQNRTFLTELKDVKRYFERNGVSKPSLKSRAAATRQLFSLLATSPVLQLEDLCRAPISDSEYSALGAISDEILSRRGRPQKR